MFKHIKIWFVTAGIFIVSGIIICTAILAVNGFDFSSLNTEPERTKSEYQIPRENAVNLTIDTRDNDIILKKTTGSEIKVTCYESEELVYDILNVKSDKNLKISEKDGRKWYQMIDVNFGIQETPLTVEIPDKDWQSIKITTSSGDINVSDFFNFYEYSINTSSGDIIITDMNAANINIESSSGDVCIKDSYIMYQLGIKTTSGETKLSKVDTSNIEINSNSGDVELYKTDAVEYKVETSSGDISGKLRDDAAYKFKVESLSGDISVPLSEKEGETLFSAVTTSGDIKIEYL